VVESSGRKEIALIVGLASTQSWSPRSTSGKTQVIRSLTQEVMVFSSVSIHIIVAVHRSQAEFSAPIRGGSRWKPCAQRHSMS